MSRLPASPPVGLLRRVLLSQLDEHSRPTLAAFLPRPKDQARLSVLLAAQVTPDRAVEIADPRFSYGVACVTTADVDSAGGLAPSADVHVVANAPPHCFVDFRRASADECKTLAAALAAAARPPPPWPSFRPHPRIS